MNACWKKEELGSVGALALGKWGHPGRTAIALAVEDVFQAAEELRAKGVKILYGPDMCVIEDPWGHLWHAGLPPHDSFPALLSRSVQD